jgi:ribosomal protein S13
LQKIKKRLVEQLIYGIGRASAKQLARQISLREKKPRDLEEERVSHIFYGVDPYQPEVTWVTMCATSAVT